MPLYRLFILLDEKIVMKIEVKDDEVPCAEYMEVVGIAQCRGCAYNLHKGHPAKGDIKTDAHGNPEALYVECGSLHPRGAEEEVAYKALADKFYGIKPEPPRPRKEPSQEPRKFVDVKHPWAQEP